MNILLVVPQIPEVGGVASVLKNLCACLQSQGHEVMFLCPGGEVFPQPKSTKWGCPVFSIRLQQPFGERHPLVSLLAFLVLFPVGMYQLVRFVQRHHIHIVNVHYPTNCFFYLALCRWILPIMLITSVHGADIFPNGRPAVHYSRAIQLLLSSSDLIVAPSQRFQSDLLNVFPELKGKTIFIHNGINLADFENPREVTKGNQARYVLCVSACKIQKALDVLIHSVKRFQKVESSLKVVVVGDGPLRRELEDLALSLGIRERIEFLGEKGHDDVVKLLHGCEAFVLPSRFETFGIAILEAMACQKPVIATAVGGIPEIIENGCNGILVEPDNPDALARALDTVLESPALRQTLASNGYVTVRHRFLREHTGAAYEFAFANFLDSSKTTVA